VATERDRIVVGIDGSPDAASAARWALAEACRQHADVDLVACWHIPHFADASPFGLVYLSPDEMMADARDRAEESLAALDADREAAERAGCRVNVRAVEGDAGHTLVTESKGASMLVVGRRGLGAIRRLVLGSVGRYIVAHADCPVVVVPPAADVAR
jgi:nucleotide-binding universal stress UspA family protein